MKTEEDIEVMRPQAEGRPEPWEARRGKERILPQSAWRDGGPADTLISELRLQHCEKTISIVLNLPGLRQFVPAG